MHLLSESGTWKTESEFVAADGTISRAVGLSRITLDGDCLENHSWVEVGESRIENTYRAKAASATLFEYEAENSSLGKQVGTFHVDRNVLYSSFEISETKMNGYEVIVREDDTCEAFGALYDGKRLVNTWRATMTKVPR